MIEEAFVQVYTKFKLNFYKSVFEKIQKRETSLTTVETYCIEIIHAICFLYSDIIAKCSI